MQHPSVQMRGITSSVVMKENKNENQYMPRVELQGQLVSPGSIAKKHDNQHVKPRSQADSSKSRSPLKSKIVQKPVQRLHNVQA